MVSIVLAGVIAVGVVGALGIGVARMMRPRRMSIVDYPELPAPKPEGTDSGEDAAGAGR